MAYGRIEKRGGMRRIRHMAEMLSLFAAIIERKMRPWLIHETGVRQRRECRRVSSTALHCNRHGELLGRMVMETQRIAT